MLKTSPTGRFNILQNNIFFSMTLIILKKMTSKGFYLPRGFLFLFIGIGKLERTIFQKQYLSIKTAKMAKCQLGEELMRQTKPNTNFIRDFHHNMESINRFHKRQPWYIKEYIVHVCFKHHVLHTLVYKKYDGKTRQNIWILYSVYLFVDI